MTKTNVIDILQDYTYYKELLAEVRKNLEKITYRVTAQYGDLAGGASGGFNNSKVERYSIHIYELHSKEKLYISKIKAAVRLIQESGLTDAEKGVMWCIAKNGKLSSYARRHHIGTYNVYKIRDRAINKIIEANKPHNVV